MQKKDCNERLLIDLKIKTVNIRKLRSGAFEKKSSVNLKKNRLKLT